MGNTYADVGCCYAGTDNAHEVDAAAYDSSRKPIWNQRLEVYLDRLENGLPIDLPPIPAVRADDAGPVPPFKPINKNAFETIAQICAAFLYPFNKLLPEDEKVREKTIRTQIQKQEPREIDNAEKLALVKGIKMYAVKIHNVNGEESEEIKEVAIDLKPLLILF